MASIRQARAGNGSVEPSGSQSPALLRLMEGGRESCQGDSRGPLVLQKGPKEWTQLGVVSCGRDCAAQDKPGFYTDVWKYFRWINETIANN